MRVRLRHPLTSSNSRVPPWTRASHSSVAPGYWRLTQRVTRWRSAEGPASFRTYHPVIIIEVLEQLLRASGATPEDVARHIRRLGYDLFEIGRFGIRTIGSDIGDIPRASDWVAVPSSDRCD